MQTNLGAIDATILILYGCVLIAPIILQREKPISGYGENSEFRIYNLEFGIYNPHF